MEPSMVDIETRRSNSPAKILAHLFLALNLGAAFHPSNLGARFATRLAEIQMADQRTGITDRQLALDVVDAVNLGGTLEQELSKPLLSKIPRKRRSFVRKLATTTTRRTAQLDKVLESALSSMPPAPAARNVMRLGAAQLLLLGIPEYAAVSTSLNLAQTTGLASYKGLINKALKKVSKDRTKEVTLDDPSAALPPWLVHELASSNGLDNVTLNGIGEALLRHDHPMDLTLRQSCSNNTSEPCLKLLNKVAGAKLLGATTVRLPPTFQSNQLPNLPGYSSGAWWVQDVASASPVLIMNNALPLLGAHVVAMSAASGANTMQLAAHGARVTAVDRSITRVKRLRAKLNRTQLLDQVDEIVQEDSTTWAAATPRGSFDGVLLDAPSTGTGLMRRNPGVLLKPRKTDEMDRLLKQQVELLNAAARMVRVGGVLVYSTCSLLHAEGEEHISNFLGPLAGDRSEKFERVPILRSEMPEELTDAVNDAGELRFYPNMCEEHGGVDGFFVCRLRRVE